MLIYLFDFLGVYYTDVQKIRSYEQNGDERTENATNTRTISVYNLLFTCYSHQL